MQKTAKPPVWCSKISPLQNSECLSLDHAYSYNKPKNSLIYYIAVQMILHVGYVFQLDNVFENDFFLLSSATINPMSLCIIDDV